MADLQLQGDGGESPRRRKSGPRERVAGEPANTPEQYDRLLEKLESAEQELSDETSLGRNAYLEAASSIVFDLLYSLDFKRGGELVPRLAAIYGYIGNELLNVSRSGDAEQLEHLRDIITTLRQSWEPAVESDVQDSPGRLAD